MYYDASHYSEEQQCALSLSMDGGSVCVCVCVEELYREPHIGSRQGFFSDLTLTQRSEATLYLPERTSK